MSGTIAASKDVFCIDAVRSGRLARGLALVAQNAYHRLITPRGTLVGDDDDADYGTDILGVIGSTEDATGILSGLIRSELTKDERIHTVNATVVRSVENDGSVTYAIDIVCTTNEGPFELAISASEELISLLKINFPEAA